MRPKLTPAAPAAALGRILDRLDRELIEASDEDILEAARDIGMNPLMKGSAAFIGLRVPAMAQFADFFDSDALRSVLSIRSAPHQICASSKQPNSRAKSTETRAWTAPCRSKKR
jgi:hypothetical protein